MRVNFEISDMEFETSVEKAMRTVLNEPERDPSGSKFEYWLFDLLDGRFDGKPHSLYLEWNYLGKGATK